MLHATERVVDICLSRHCALQAVSAVRPLARRQPRSQLDPPLQADLNSKALSSHGAGQQSSQPGADLQDVTVHSDIGLGDAAEDTQSDGNEMLHSIDNEDDDAAVSPVEQSRSRRKRTPGCAHQREKKLNQRKSLAGGAAS